MADAARPGDAFAVGNDEQYRPVRAAGDQRVLVSGPEGTGRLACHASRPLGGPRRGPVVVVVHGALRDSDRYLASAQHAARLAGSDALIVAPQFLAEVDPVAGALYWTVEGWKGGYPALGPTALSSFAAMDSLLGQLAPEPGPDPAVVVFGNSAGGQFVNRYAAVGRGPGLLAGRGLRVRFVIANPSTYLYFDRERPVAGRTARASTTGATGSTAPPVTWMRDLKGRGRAWSATSAATSPSCSARWIPRAPPRCSR